MLLEKIWKKKAKPASRQEHFYGHDLWSQFGKTIENSIPSNVIVYGELVGYTGDAPIQKGHTYAAAPGEAMLYVYRVSLITDAGDLFDLSWDQVRTFCLERGLNHVPELWRGFKRDFDLPAFEEKDFARYDYGYAGMHGKFAYVDRPVALSPGGTGADEGIAIRVDRGDRVPLLFKFKNPSHYLYETAQLDAGEVDLESAEVAA